MPHSRPSYLDPWIHSRERASATARHGERAAGEGATASSNTHGEEHDLLEVVAGGQEEGEKVAEKGAG